MQNNDNVTVEQVDRARVIANRIMLHDAIVGNDTGDQVLRIAVAFAADEIDRLSALAQGRGEVERLREEIINTPETADFMAGVPIEALHQRERWGSAHDAGKTPEDWFWLIGYLAQKALRAQNAGDLDKAMHHTISTAAACANWHAAISGEDTSMRPGIGPAALARPASREKRAVGIDGSTSVYVQNADGSWPALPTWTEPHNPSSQEVKS